MEIDEPWRERRTDGLASVGQVTAAEQVFDKTQLQH